MSETYILSPGDSGLISSAQQLLKKILAREETTPAQLVSIGKLLHALAVLPAVTPIKLASVSITGPRNQFGDLRTYHWYGFAVEDGCLRVSSGGHFYQPSSGGDTFTTMQWLARPGSPSEVIDHLDDLWMVPDVKSFQVGVDNINLATVGHRVEVLDQENPLLDEQVEELESACPFKGEDTTDSSTSHTKTVHVGWLVTAQTASELLLAAIVDKDDVDANTPAFAYDPESCNECGCDLDECQLFVDGRLRGRTVWSHMCADCFVLQGEGVGHGSGQLYGRQSDGAWRLVAGFAPK